MGCITMQGFIFQFFSYFYLIFFFFSIYYLIQIGSKVQNETKIPVLIILIIYYEWGVSQCRDLFCFQILVSCIHKEFLSIFKICKMNCFTSKPYVTYFHKIKANFAEHLLNTGQILCLHNQG